MSLEEGRKLWSLQPPQFVPGASIDSLVDAKLVEKKLKPNAPASRAALLRRLHLDLTGLPPADGVRQV